jgi:hypothetical protein
MAKVPDLTIRVVTILVRRPPSRWMRFWHRALLGWDWDGIQAVEIHTSDDQAQELEP